MESVATYEFRRLAHAIWLACLASLILAPYGGAKWRYFRLGNDADKRVTPTPGYALMGGGSKRAAAYDFLCQRANGGDLLILRAGTDDDYAKKVNAEMKGICPLNSAATVVFSDREDSDDPKIAGIIAHAESIFLAGGDQSNYVRFWQDTPVQAALNRHIAQGKPIGGSSAGLAILGQFSFSSMIDTIHSGEALADPYGNKVTLSREFLDIPFLRGTITDTHFVKRDRLGRLLVFMGRILKDGWADRVRAIAVEENAAVLVEPDGSAKVVGEGPAYFLEAATPPEICAQKQPLAFSGISAVRVQPNRAFQLKTWRGDGEAYTLSVISGIVRSSRPDRSLY
jgi:cyanophycinase